MSAVKKAAKVWTCSESLAQIYEKKNKLYFDYIRNGVDVSKYSRVKNNKEKIILRQKLKLPIEKTIFIYTGQFIERKDQEFLLEIFSKKSELENFVLLMLGDGENFKVQKKQFERNTNIIFAGNVDNVEEYLKASDYYISSSRSEGLPTSVLEAMSAGLPVILSNITQHKELMGINNQIGIMYELGNQTDCVKKILEILGKDRNELSNAAYICVHTSLNATTMSQKYQDEYMNVIKKNAGVLV
jgi:glycosyltransferase involved in cell wall biosynthesis